jgi:hypothetical protein
MLWKLLLLQGTAKLDLLKAEGKDHEARLVAAGVAAAEEDLREYQQRIQNGGRRGWVLVQLCCAGRRLNAFRTAGDLCCCVGHASASPTCLQTRIRYSFKCPLP